MSELDIINSIASEPIRPPEHVTLETIISDVPNMSLDNPATYALYIYYNPHLGDDEKAKVEAIIEKFKVERQKINDKNKEYMERHLKEEKIKELEEVPEAPKLERS
jgi:hypothetical protein|tara:strand:- start:4048 stop:4365 length:318 start_codon:yes stop_codon:yes gene_type:complete